MLFKALKQLGVLGMNARIGRYMSPQNPRRLYPLVDDKTKTAQLAEAFKIPMPKTYFVFSSYGDARHLSEILKNRDSFVIKPVRGAQGNGIIVIQRRVENGFEKPSGTILPFEDLRYHILQIMSGLYSLNGYPDQALLQEKVNTHPSFEDFCTQGVPDVRVIIYGGFPIMAMVRLPTLASEGRANLHQGAVGAGIDMLSGKVTAAICHDKLIEVHPDTKIKLTQLDVPYWKDLLHIAAQCYDITGMGYLGVDLVVDAEKGPMVLELNARPGLSIQVANQVGLKNVLESFEPFVKNTHEQKVEERVETSLRIWQKNVF